MQPCRHDNEARCEPSSGQISHSNTGSLGASLWATLLDAGSSHRRFRLQACCCTVDLPAFICRLYVPVKRSCTGCAESVCCRTLSWALHKY